MSVTQQIERIAHRRTLLAERPAVIAELERDLRSRLDSQALAAHGAEQTRSSLRPEDLESLRSGDWATDDRAISAGRLYLDCARTVPYLTKGFGRRDRQAIANVAAAYIAEHTPFRVDRHEQLERQARARATASRGPNRAARVSRYIDLLEAGADAPQPAYGLPLRREWLDSDGRPTEEAWRLMRVAIRHGARALKAGSSAQTTLMDGESLAAMAERAGDSTETEGGTVFGALADARADDLATVLGLPLNAARAIEHDALITRYIGSIPADATEDERTTGVKMAASLALDSIAGRERISRAGLQVAISRGHSILRERYPEPRELRAALEDACSALRAMATDRLALALSDYANGWATEADAREALDAYRSTYAGMAPSRSALERAFIRHAMRAGLPASVAVERAPLISLWATRLMRAEQGRADRIGLRRIVTTGTARAIAGRDVRVVRSGGYGKRTARIYPRPMASRLMLTRDARRTMVALAGNEWRRSTGIAHTAR